jgi:hypothetical protein
MIAGTAAAAVIDGAIIVTNNDDLTTLEFWGSSLKTLTITGNSDLTKITGDKVIAIGATAGPTVTIHSNDLEASVAQVLTTTTGAFTTNSNIGSLAAYFKLVQADVKSNAAVYFDTVQSTTSSVSVETGSTTTYAVTPASNVILKTTPGSGGVTTGNNAAVKEQRAWLIDNNQAANGLSLTVDTVQILHNGSGYGLVTMTGNNSIDLVAIKTALATSRATTLGVTLDAAASGNSVAPTITFLATTSSATGSNGENYTNAQVAAIGAATNNSFITTYDGFTVGVGNLSVTATLVDAAATPYAVASGTTTVGITALAARIATVWNAKYGAAGTSSTLSTWGNMSSSAGVITIAAKASSRGSRGNGDVVTVAWAKATAAQVSNVTAGTMSTAATYLAGHSMDWKIGATEASTDNAAAGTDIIITLLEGTNTIDAATGQASLTVAATKGIELLNTSFPNAAGGAGTATSTASNIYPLEARLDVIRKESANEGVTTATVARVSTDRSQWTFTAG